MKKNETPSQMNIIRPSLDEIPKDLEFKREIEESKKFAKDSLTFINWSIFGFALIYFGIAIYLGIDFKYIWLVGFPAFWIVYSLFRIEAHQRITFHAMSKINEYHMVHTLNRLEEIHNEIKSD